MSLAGWDAGRTTTSSHSMTMNVDDWSSENNNNKNEDINKAKIPVELTNAKNRFLNFIRNFKEDKIFTYRDQLRRNYTLFQYFLEVNFVDLNSFDEELANLLLQYPSQLLPLFEEAGGEAAKLVQVWREDENLPYVGGIEQQHLRPQIIIKSTQKPIFIRNLHSEHIGKLVVVPGIIISATRVHAKAIYLQLACRYCGNRKSVAAAAGFSSTPLPVQCDSQKLKEVSDNADNNNQYSSTKCGPNPYLVLGDSCEYVDQQSLKLQEAPEDVPTGEMPRHLMLSVDRRLVSISPPGSRVVAVGIYSVTHSMNRIGETGCESVYLQVIGLQVNEDGEGRTTNLFSRKDEENFIELSRRSNIYTQIAESIAPAIYGHEDIKKAIGCLLFGGSKKALPDGVRLRGDINVLLLGDPGTAKSQFLKFVERVAPIGVYTSGKGSSAAGLTASVVRDSHSKEYYLEGGAMVLADGGVVCIDEFDKMHSHDRVAIHEAMEQQTISIAKAGITTTLNARTSVLAAANPVFGSYDDLRSPTENIEFQTTILSRFDMIFVVRDPRNASRDKMIADHVMKVHMNLQREKLEGEIDTNLLKRYIAYCRQRCTPCLSNTAAEILQSHYVNIRASIHTRDSNSSKQSAIPITVRQLEAIIRITESLAKMAMSPVATEEHVNEAIRLFKVSTLEAALSGAVGSESVSPEMMEEVNAAEALLKKRLPIGSRISMQHLLQEFEYKQKLSRFAVQKAVSILAQRDEIQFRNQRKMILRVR